MSEQNASIIVAANAIRRRVIFFIIIGAPFFAALKAAIFNSHLSDSDSGARLEGNNPAPSG